LLNFDLKKELLPGLPAYEGGRMSDYVYNAGKGLHARLNDGKPLYTNWAANIEYCLSMLKYLKAAGFTVTNEVFDGGHISFNVSMGDVVYKFERTENGISIIPISIMEKAKVDKPVLLRTVTETTGEAFDAYLDKLQREGFKITWYNQIEDNRYYELQRDGRMIWAAYTPGTASARFTDDPISESMTIFSGGEALPDVNPKLCQFALYYSYMRPGESCNCGMLYILTLPDNSLVLIDGGEYEQATDAACKEIMRVMRLMTGVPEGQPLRIAAWICTHAHDDHLDLFGKLIRFYHHELILERVIFNFPADEYYLLMPQTFILLDRINRYYPNVRYLKARAGQSFTLAGVRFDVLLSHEDGPSVTGKETIGNFNDTSIVMKIIMDGVSFLLTGDIDNGAEKALLSRFTSHTLQCDIVQAAHHLINMLPDLYCIVNAKTVLIPQHIRRAMPNNEKYISLMNAMPTRDYYFASTDTAIFEMKAGEYRLIYREVPVGGVYDGSEI